MIYLATDHAGFELKEIIKKYLENERIEIRDFGALSLESGDDYPDYISLAAEAVSKDFESKAIILGGSGQGEAIVANKFPGVRAAVYYGGLREIPTLARQHNDANILSLGAKFVDKEEALEAVKLFLNTPFSNEERHKRRIEKIKKVEKSI